MIGIGSNSPLTIGIAVRLVNNFSTTARTIGASMTALERRAYGLHMSALNNLGGIGLAFTAMGAGILYGVNKAVKASAELQSTLKYTQLVLRGTAKDFDILWKSSQRLATQFPYSSLKIAKGMEEIAKATPLNAKEIPSLMKGMLKIAMAAREPLEGEHGVVSTTLGMMMAWGRPVTDVSAIGNQITKAALISKASYSSIAESMAYAQATLKPLGYTIEEALAMIAAMSNVGVSGSMAGTSIENMASGLNQSLGSLGRNKNRKAAIAQMGLKPSDFYTVDQNGARIPLNLIKTLTVLQKGLATQDPIGKQNILNTLFGKRGQRAGNPLIDFLSKNSGMGQSLEKILEAIVKAPEQNDLDRVTKGLRNTTTFQLERLSNNWLNLSQTLGKNMTPDAIRFLDSMNGMLEGLNRFASTPAGKNVTRLVAGLGVVLLALGSIAVITRTIGYILISNGRMFQSAMQGLRLVFNTLASGRVGTAIAGILGRGGRAGINAAGSLINPATGRITLTAASMARMPILGGILRWFVRLAPALGRFGGILFSILRFGNMLGWIYTAFTFFTGANFKQALILAFGGIISALFEIYNGLMYMKDLVTPGADAGLRSGERRKKFYENMGISKAVQNAGDGPVLKRPGDPENSTDNLTKSIFKNNPNHFHIYIDGVEQNITNKLDSLVQNKLISNLGIGN